MTTTLRLAFIRRVWESGLEWFWLEFYQIKSISAIAVQGGGGIEKNMSKPWLLPHKEILFSFKGRIPRGVFALYWISTAVLYFLILFVVIRIADLFLLGTSRAYFLTAFLIIPFLFLLRMHFALAYKRLQDGEWPGWIYGVVFLSGVLVNQISPLLNEGIFRIVGGSHLLITFGLLIFLFFIKGTLGPNKFGPDPLRKNYE